MLTDEVSGTTDVEKPFSGLLLDSGTTVEIASRFANAHVVYIDGSVRNQLAGVGVYGLSLGLSVSTGLGSYCSVY
jgi:hypothetical protein